MDGNVPLPTDVMKVTGLLRWTLSCSRKYPDGIHLVTIVGHIS